MLTTDEKQRTDTRLLVVEDEPNILELLSASLRYAGFDVVTAAAGTEAVQAAQRHRPDLIVLDVMLPDMDGFDVVRRLRSGGARVPVVFLTARDATEDKIRGLTLGGDDYVTKPFSLEEVIARIRAVLRRTSGEGGEPTPRLTFADLELDEESHEVWRAGQQVQLSPTEFKLLRYFMSNANRVLSKMQILDHVWDYDFRGDTGIVESYVSVLRRKIDTVEPRLIHTLRGVGYVLRLPSSSDLSQARTGTEGLATDSAFRHPLEAMTRLSQRTPLRIKLITALLALVALALAVISFTSVAVFSGYLENQVDSQVQSLATQSANSPPPSPHQSETYTFLGFVYEVLDAQGNVVPYFGNGQAIGASGPDVPTSASWLTAHAGHPVTVPASSGSGQWRIIEQPASYTAQDRDPGHGDAGHRRQPGQHQPHHRLPDQPRRDRQPDHHAGPGRGRRGRGADQPAVAGRHRGDRRANRGRPPGPPGTGPGSADRSRAAGPVDQHDADPDRVGVP